MKDSMSPKKGGGGAGRRRGGMNVIDRGRVVGVAPFHLTFPCLSLKIFFSPPFDLKTFLLDRKQLLLHRSGAWQQVEGEEASGGAFPSRPRKRLSLLAAPE